MANDHFPLHFPATLFEIFKAKFGVSARTGQDWTDPFNVPVDNQSYTVSVQFTVQPRTLTEVWQVIGVCGDLRIKTQNIMLMPSAINGTVF